MGYNLSRVTSTDTEKNVALGGCYETILSPEVKSVSIKMDGAELASSASIYNPTTSRDNITNVSGDIIIRATAKDRGGSGGGGGATSTDK